MKVGHCLTIGGSVDVGGIYVRVVCVHVCTYRMYVRTYVRTPVCVVYGTCKKNITTRSIRTCLHIRPCVPPYVTSQTYTPVRKL